MKKFLSIIFIIHIIFLVMSCTVEQATEIIVFEDDGLENAIRDVINKDEGDILNIDVDDIESLNLRDKSIVSLEGIQYLTSLEELDLEDNFIDDVSPMASLENLRWLSLRNNQITDLSEINFDQLSELELTYLSLRHNVVDLNNDEENRISDISLLENMTSLEMLELRDLQINDLSPIASLTGLTYLDISQNPLSDTTLSALSDINDLTYLNVRETGATDLSVIADMTDLTYLNIHSNTQLESMDFLMGLTNLESLIAENVPIGNQMNVFSDLYDLMEVNLQNTGINDLSVLADLMSEGALQDQILQSKEASVNIISNPLSAESYSVLEPYWENITNRLPMTLPMNNEANPIINEFMASNGSSIVDYIGDSSDWIEIYNPSTSALDISGYYLSDDLDDPMKWAFPEETVIPSLGYLVVFASGKNFSIGDEIHTNFRLSQDGEPILLTALDGVTILDQIPVTEMPRDYSYGRLGDANNQWVYFDLLNATPGTSNDDAEPYDDEGSVIPTDFVYNIESFDRMFNDTRSKNIIVKITQEEWDDLDDHMVSFYNVHGNYRTSYYAKADFIYEDELGQITIGNVGFRTRGNLSRVRIEEDDGTLNMSHFKISFHETFNEDTYRANDIRTVFEVEELDMKWNANGDTTHLTEKFSLDLMSDFGVHAANTTLANLYIEIGDVRHYYGLYTIFEPIDQFFLERRMTEEEASGDLYKSLWQHYGPATLWDDYPSRAIGIKNAAENYRPTYDLKTNKGEYNIQLLEFFIEQVDRLDDEAFDSYISTYFDVDQFLRYLAVNTLLGNPDDYRAMANNYYLYHDPFNDLWMVFPYDFDHGLGQGWNPFGDHSIGLDIYDWYDLNGELTGSNRPNPLSYKILQIERYQLTYESYLNALINPENNYFSYDDFYDLYITYKDLYPDVPFTLLRDRADHMVVEDYMTLKIQEINRQLTYYQNNPQERP